MRTRLISLIVLFALAVPVDAAKRAHHRRYTAVKVAVFTVGAVAAGILSFQPWSHPTPCAGHPRGCGQ